MCTSTSFFKLPPPDHGVCDIHLNLAPTRIALLPVNTNTERALTCLVRIFCEEVCGINGQIGGVIAGICVPGSFDAQD